MNLPPNSSRKRPGLRPTPAMPHKVQLTTLHMQLDGSPSGTVKLSSLGRLRATVVRRSSCSSNSASTTVAFLARGSDLLPDGWERMDERRINRGNAGAVGGIAAGGEGADAPLVHAGTGGGLGGGVFLLLSGGGAAQDGLDAGGSGG